MVGLNDGPAGIGCVIAVAFFAVAIGWIACDGYHERQCRERQWRWTGWVGVDGRCEEP